MKNSISVLILIFLVQLFSGCMGSSSDDKKDPTPKPTETKTALSYYELAASNFSDPYMVSTSGAIKKNVIDLAYTALTDAPKPEDATAKEELIKNLNMLLAAGYNYYGDAIVEEQKSASSKSGKRFVKRDGEMTPEEALNMGMTYLGFVPSTSVGKKAIKANILSGLLTLKPGDAVYQKQSEQAIQEVLLVADRIDQATELDRIKAGGIRIDSLDVLIKASEMFLKMGDTSKAIELLLKADEKIKNSPSDDLKSLRVKNKIADTYMNIAAGINDVNIKNDILSKAAQALSGALAAADKAALVTESSSVEEKLKAKAVVEALIKLNAITKSNADLKKVVEDKAKSETGTTVSLDDKVKQTDTIANNLNTNGKKIIDVSTIRYKTSDQYDKASQMVDVDKNLEDINTAYFLLSSGQFADAKQLFLDLLTRTDVIKNSDYVLKVKLGLAKAYEALKDYNNAILTYNSIIELYSDPQIIAQAKAEIDNINKILNPTAVTTTAPIVIMPPIFDGSDFMPGGKLKIDVGIIYEKSIKDCYVKIFDVNASTTTAALNKISKKRSLSGNMAGNDRTMTIFRVAKIELKKNSAGTYSGEALMALETIPGEYLLKIVAEGENGAIQEYPVGIKLGEIKEKAKVYNIIVNLAKDSTDTNYVKFMLLGVKNNDVKLYVDGIDVKISSESGIAVFELKDSYLTIGEHNLSVKIVSGSEVIYNNQIKYVVQGKDLTDSEKNAIQDTVRDILNNFSGAKDAMLKNVDSNSSVYALLKAKLPENVVISRSIKNIVANNTIVMALTSETINNNVINQEYRFGLVSGAWKINEIKFVDKWLEYINITESIDTDRDGLTDKQETSVYKTDPNVADTDGDGSKDGTEILMGTNPLDKSDYPGADANIDKAAVAKEVTDFVNMLISEFNGDNFVAEAFVKKYFVTEKAPIAEMLKAKKEFMVKSKVKIQAVIPGTDKFAIEKANGTITAAFETKLQALINSEARFELTAKIKLIKAKGVTEWKVVFFEKFDSKDGFVMIPGDGVDNDGDGLIDEEIANGLDDDGDGLIDEDLAWIKPGVNKLTINVKGTNLKNIKITIKGAEFKKLVTKDEKIVIEQLPAGQELKVSILTQEGYIYEKVLTLTADSEITAQFFNILTPKDNENIETAQFSWDKIAAKEFWLGVTKERNKNFEEYDYIKIKLDGQVLSWTFKKEGVEGIVSELIPNTKYYVAVKAVIDGNTSVITNPVGFMIKAAQGQKFIKIKGTIYSKDINVKGTVIIFKHKNGTIFRTTVQDSTKFWDETKKMYALPYEINVLEGNYNVNAFLDLNGNGSVDSGEYQNVQTPEVMVVNDQQLNMDMQQVSDTSAEGISGPDVVNVGTTAFYKSVPSDVKWSLSDENIAAIDAAGSLKALKEGNLVIKAITTDGRAFTKTVKLVAVMAPAITGTDKIITGNTEQFMSNVVLTDWQTSDKSVAQIIDVKPTADGKGNIVQIKGNRAGSFTITAKTATGEVISKSVRVVNATPMPNEGITGPDVLEVDKTATYMCNTSSTGITWSIDDATIAVILVPITAKTSGAKKIAGKSAAIAIGGEAVISNDKQVIVKALKAGAFTLTAKSEDGKEFKKSVKVNEATQIKVEIKGPDVITAGGIFTYNILPATTEVTLWDTDNKEIAQIVPQTSVIPGTVNVKGLKEGAFTLIATLKNGNTVKKTVKVAGIIPPVKVEINGPDNLTLGETFKYNIVPGSTEVVLWDVDNKEIAQIILNTTSGGLNIINVKGLKEGAFTLIATLKDGNTVKKAIKVVGVIPPIKVEINGPDILTAGEIFKYNIVPSSTEVVLWDVDNKDIAQIILNTTSGGLNIINVKGLKEGAFTLVATLKDGNTVKKAVKVVGVIPPVKVEINGPDNLTIGEMFKYNIVPGSTEVVLWDVDNKDIAQIILNTTSGGLNIINVKGLKEGGFTLIATLKDGNTVKKAVKVVGGVPTGNDGITGPESIQAGLVVSYTFNTASTTTAVTWTIDDLTIAQIIVDPTFVAEKNIVKVKGLKEGTFNLIATTNEGKTYKKAVKVFLTIPPLQPAINGPDSITVGGIFIYNIAPTGTEVVGWDLDNKDVAQIVPLMNPIGGVVNIKGLKEGAFTLIATLKDKTIVKKQVRVTGTTPTVNDEIKGLETIQAGTIAIYTFTSMETAVAWSVDNPAIAQIMDLAMPAVMPSAVNIKGLKEGTFNLIATAKDGRVFKKFVKVSGTLPPIQAVIKGSDSITIGGIFIYNIMPETTEVALWDLDNKEIAQIVPIVTAVIPGTVNVKGLKEGGFTLIATLKDGTIVKKPVKVTGTTVPVIDEIKGPETIQAGTIAIYTFTSMETAVAWSVDNPAIAQIMDLAMPAVMPSAVNIKGLKEGTFNLIATAKDGRVFKKFVKVSGTLPPIQAVIKGPDSITIGGIFIYNIMPETTEVVLWDLDNKEIAQIVPIVTAVIPGTVNVKGLKEGGFTLIATLKDGTIVKKPVKVTGTTVPVIDEIKGPDTIQAGTTALYTFTSMETAVAWSIDNPGIAQIMELAMPAVMPSAVNIKGLKEGTFNLIATAKDGRVFKKFVKVSGTLPPIQVVINGPESITVGGIFVYNIMPTTTEVVLWDLDNKEIAQILPIVTAVIPGTVNVKGLKEGGFTLIATLKDGTILKKPVKVTGTTPPINDGIKGPDTIQVGVPAIYTFTSLEIPVAWSIDNPSVAQIMDVVMPAVMPSSVSIKGLKEGTFNLIATTKEGMVYKKLVKVTGTLPPVNSEIVGPEAIQVGMVSIYTLTNITTTAVAWVISDTTVAQIINAATATAPNSVSIKGLKEGSFTLTAATADGKTYTKTVKVSGTITPIQAVINGPESITVGGIFVYNIMPTTTEVVLWDLDNKEIAQIVPQVAAVIPGAVNVKGLKEGGFTLMATLKDGTIVKKPVRVAGTTPPVNDEIKGPETIQVGVPSIYTFTSLVTPVAWSIDDPTIAQIMDVVMPAVMPSSVSIKALKEGTFSLIATTREGMVFKKLVKVTGTIPPVDVVINGSERITMGAIFIYNIIPIATEVALWDIDNKDIAQIVPQVAAVIPGTVNIKGLKVGTFNLIATLKDGRIIKKMVTVTEASPPVNGQIMGPDTIILNSPVTYSFNQTIAVIWSVDDSTMATISNTPVSATSPINAVTVIGIKAGTFNLIATTKEGVVYKKLIKVEGNTNPPNEGIAGSEILQENTTGTYIITAGVNVTSVIVDNSSIAAVGDSTGMGTTQVITAIRAGKVGSCNIIAKLNDGREIRKLITVTPGQTTTAGIKITGVVNNNSGIVGTVVVRLFGADATGKPATGSTPITTVRPSANGTYEIVMNQLSAGNYVLVGFVDVNNDGKFEAEPMGMVLLNVMGLPGETITAAPIVIGTVTPPANSKITGVIVNKTTAAGLLIAQLFKIGETGKPVTPFIASATQQANGFEMILPTAMISGKYILTAFVDTDSDGTGNGEPSTTITVDVRGTAGEIVNVGNIEIVRPIEPPKYGVTITGTVLNKSPATGAILVQLFNDDGTGKPVAGSLIGQIPLSPTSANFTLFSAAATAGNYVLVAFVDINGDGSNNGEPFANKPIIVKGTIDEQLAVGTIEIQGTTTPVNETRITGLVNNTSGVTGPINVQLYAGDANGKLIGGILVEKEAGPNGFELIIPTTLSAGNYVIVAYVNTTGTVKPSGVKTIRVLGTVGELINAGTVEIMPVPTVPQGVRITGVVNNNSGIAGQLVVQLSNKDANNNPIGLPVKSLSLGNISNFEMIFDTLAPGSYVMTAFVDTDGTGMYLGTKPHGMKTVVVVGGVNESIPIGSIEIPLATPPTTNLTKIGGVITNTSGLTQQIIVQLYVNNGGTAPPPAPLMTVNATANNTYEMSLTTLAPGQYVIVAFVNANGTSSPNGNWVGRANFAIVGSANEVINVPVIINMAPPGTPPTGP